MTNEMNKKDLVDLAKAGDRAAFEKLSACYYERLRSFVTARTGKSFRGKTEVEDICQESILKAFRSLSGFTWQGEQSFFRWLAGIALNLIRHLARSHRLSERIGIDDFSAVDETSPSKHMRREERFDRLQDAVDALSPDHRRIILLTRIEGFSVEAAAEKMNRSPKAARQLLWRALQSLRKQFKGTESLSLPDRSLKGAGGDNELH